MDTLLDFLLTFAVLGGMAFLVAQMSKDREVGFWTLFVVSVFLTPFIGIFVALVSKKKRNPNAPPGPVDVKGAQDKFWDRFMPNKNDDKNDMPPHPDDDDDGGVQPQDRGSSKRKVSL